MRIVHIFQVEPDEGMEWNHNDWFYKLTEKIDGQFIRLGKLYKNRSSASRAGGRIGKVEHWYLI